MDLYPALLVSLTIGAMRAAIDAWQGRGQVGSLDDLIDDAIDVLAHGLRLPHAAGARGH